jgi:hypothetical protein
MQKRYYPLSDYLKERFNRKVRKVSVDGGFTCPNRDNTVASGGCVYCEPDTLRRKGAGPDLSVTAQIDAGMAMLSRNRRADACIAYFQVNSSTYGPIERLRPLYEEALLHPLVAGISIATRPDCVGEEVLDLLAGLSSGTELWLELGLQSANDSTLARLNRGHTVKDFTGAFERASRRGLKVVAHVMAGLPFEPPDAIVDTARLLADIGVWGVKFHQLQVIKGTRLEKAFLHGEIPILELEEYARLVVECLELLPPDSVIHRLAADAPPEFLAAPAWEGGKRGVIRRIEDMLLERGTRQGARLAGN